MDLLKGASAYLLARIGFFSFAAGLATLGMLFFARDSDEALSGGLVVVPLLTIVGFVAEFAMYVREKAERAAGYTTYNGRARELIQVDDRSGYVLREADEPLLQRDVWRSRVKMARQMLTALRASGDRLA